MALTAEQLRAGLSGVDRINIEAAPGSGKTTVAAERFGVYRFAAGADPRGVLALSFTRSARDVLALRVRSRWGTRALGPPHRALTFDSLHLVLLKALLDGGHISWGHTGEDITVLNSWRGVSGCRPMSAPGSRWVAKLVRGSVVHGAAPVETRGDWMSAPAGIAAALAAGQCTHDDVRNVVHGAMSQPNLRAVLHDVIAARFRAVVVDEVYDANAEDLELLTLFCDTGTPMTVIGDRWQALYGFRGARPDLVPAVLARFGFVELQVTQSFRYATDRLADQMASLRRGLPLLLDEGLAGDCDVVLATGWAALWSSDDVVLPISIGEVRTRSDALFTLLLNRVTTTRLGIQARNYAESCFLLGVPEDDAGRSAALDGFVHLLVTAADPPAMDDLRGLHRVLGLARRPSRPRERGEQDLNRTLERLRSRVRQERLIAGLSVHQAKGQEWDRVGVRLKATERKRLKSGLDSGSAHDRVLYVAVTRARYATVAV